MRNALCVVLVVAGVVLAGHIGQSRVDGYQGAVTCYEDEAVLWDGERHSLCWPVDDLWMLQEVR